MSPTTRFGFRWPSLAGMPGRGRIHQGLGRAAYSALLPASRAKSFDELHAASVSTQTRRPTRDDTNALG